MEDIKKIFDESIVVVKIHEHLNPFRERVARVETKVESQDSLINAVKRDVADLNAKVDDNHADLLLHVNQIKIDMLKAFEDHDEKDEVAFRDFLNHFTNYKQELDKLRWSIAGGTTVLVALVPIGIYLFEHWPVVK